MAQFEDDKFLVLKWGDIRDHLPAPRIQWLESICDEIGAGRQMMGKERVNQYYVCNRDEPYAREILVAIMRGEDDKANGVVKRDLP